MQKIDRRARIHSLALAGVAGLALLAGAPALAQSHGYDRPAEPLSKALRDFGQVSGRQIVFTDDLVQGKTAPAIKGSFTADQALDRILAGSGLHAERTPSGALMVMRRPPAAPLSDADAGGEIVVTAQKKAERLIDTPQSVTAVSGAALQTMAATQLRDFADSVPGLSFQSAGAGQSQITIRGVTTGADISPTVGIYVDDVAFGSTTNFARAAGLALDLGLFDVDRIEVLRGPQGTLYGASTMGGLLKYVSVKPNSQRSGFDMQAGISSTRSGGVSYNGAAVANLPIARDKAALRVTGYYSHDGGYIDNVARGEKDVNRSRVYGARGDLLLTPTERLSIRIGAYLQNIRRNGIATADYDMSGRPVYGSLKQSRPFDEPFQQRFRLVSGTIGYDLGFASLTSITSYQMAHTLYQVDYSPTYVGFLAAFGLGSYGGVANRNDETTRKFTEEVRLASGGNGRLEWIVGGFYDHESSDNVQGLQTLSLAGAPIANNLFTFSGPSTYDEVAGFANATFHVTPKFDVSGGVRYAHIEQRTEGIGGGVLGSSNPKRGSTDKVATWLANARYRFSRQATAYFRYATSYRPGGPNLIANDPATGQPFGSPTFRPDRLASYELGFRGETADRSFAADLSTYYIKWDDLQVVATRNGFGLLTNATGGASIRGAEMTLTARPTRGFVVVGAFAYQNARVDHADADLGAYRHERLPNVPRYTASITADYEFAQIGTVRPSLGASLRAVSDRMTSFDLSNSVPQTALPSYARVDLRAGIAVGTIKAQLYVHNLFDDRSLTQSPTFGSTFGGPYQFSVLQPRTIGMTLSTHF